jgi:hypothetical protein
MVVEAVTTCAEIVDFASLLGKSAPLPLAGSEASEARSRGWGWGSTGMGPRLGRGLQDAHPAMTTTARARPELSRSPC